MIGNSLRWVLLLFMLVSLPALACNLVSGDDDVTLPGGDGDGAVGSADEGPATLVPGATVPASEGEDNAGDGPALPQFGTLNDALAQFNSYRIQIHMRFEDSGDPAQSGTLTMSTARVLEPPASSTEMRVSGAFSEDMEELGEGATISFVEVEGTGYSVVPGLGCLPGLGGAEMAGGFDDVLDADEFLSELENAEYVGEDTVNGVATNHYRLDESSFAQEENGLREVRGDLYVSQEHQYVVRMVLDGVGDVDLLGEGQGDGNVHIELNVLDVGQPINIEVPAECESAGTDYPVMEGAVGLSSFAGVTNYSIDGSLEEVVTFYQEEMAARGYQMADDSFITESAALMSFNAEGMPTVSVTLGADGETVSVLITSEGN